ncbi:MAG: zinc-ribbon domain-containing protein [Erysipelotrichaceae bacterium]|nr:zinc-ribbon domain-containing protein [Erysipelotrichaceae bacterium]
MAEWDWEENNKINLDPRKLTFGSGKKANWICSKYPTHKWATSIYSRTTKNTNCPYCSNKKVLPGYNDLKSQRPDLMSEWDFETNTIDPSMVTVKSNKLANWICPKEHRYTKHIYNRVKGEECPDCAKARGTSFPEQCFFYYIKKFCPDAVNRYKDIFNNKMELDIYIPSIKTGIEYDGVFWHRKDAQSRAREETKHRICKENNIRLFRLKEGGFTGFADNADRIWYVPTKCDDATLDYYILYFLSNLTFFSTKLPDVNVARDRAEILEYKTLRLENSLLYQYPDIAKEWHPTKNGKLTPDQFTPGSGESVWWRCPKCGNEWKTSIANRASGHGCDKCATSVRMKTRKTNILSERGSIDKEWCLLDWDYEENEYGPEHYTNGSGEIVSWKCHKCGHKWKTAICNRTRDFKNGCPSCSGKTIIRGVNDLPFVKPELMQDWDYENNTNIDPTKVGRGSHLKVSWKCHICDYRWEAQIYNRANGKGCPCCANRVVVPGKNDLATTSPDLAAEWHPTLNELKPTEVTRGQSIKAYWICSKCGNVWQDTINHRSGGRGCSKCSKSKKRTSD